METHLVLKELAAKRKRYNRLQLLSQHQERVVASAGVARIHVGVVPHTRSQEVEIANIKPSRSPTADCKPGVERLNTGPASSLERFHVARKNTQPKKADKALPWSRISFQSCGARRIISSRKRCISSPGKRHFVLQVTATGIKVTAFPLMCCCAMLHCCSRLPPFEPTI